MAHRCAPTKRLLVTAEVKGSQTSLDYAPGKESRQPSEGIPWPGYLGLPRVSLYLPLFLALDPCPRASLVARCYP